MSKIAVVVFPGTNCELDVAWAIQLVGGQCELIFHDESDLTKYGGAVLAGGFAHGDYLRPGAIARFSPVMKGLRRMADDGRPVIGICNGFQILCEASFLPGALCKNTGLRFICGPVHVRIDNASTVMTSLCSEGEVLKNIPINHFEGCYTADKNILAEMEANGQIVFRYCSPSGEIDDEWNPNGSVNAIAGISNKEGNVVGLMPHPERAMETITGSDSGRPLIESVVAAASAGNFREVLLG